MLRLRTFGGLYIEGGEEQRADLDGRQQLLALLTVLASGGERGISRTAVARIFWPESTHGSDRTALSTALYRLRRFLGADIVTGKETLCLNPAAITSDLSEFEECVRLRQFDRAAQLYEGEFLKGFSLRTAGGFDDWASGQRARLALAYRQVLERAPSDAVTPPVPRPSSTHGPPPHGAPPSKPAHARRLARFVGLAALVPAIGVLGYGAARALEPSVKILEPIAGDTVEVREPVTVVTRHKDLWLWIRTGGQCWLRGPFKETSANHHTLLAQFGQDGPRQSGYPYWFVVLAEPRLAPVHRVEDRRLDDCRFELLQPVAHSDTVGIYRR